MLLQLQRSPERERALQDMIEAMHNPQSPSFHHWLSNDDLFTDYGPAQQDIDTVVSWLGSNGFTVNSVNPNGMLIDFSGNAGQVKRAFATTLHRYNLNGKVYLSNASDPSIPAALAPVVVGIVSLNNLFPQPQLHEPIAAAKGKFDLDSANSPAKSTPVWNPEFTIGSGTRYLVAPYDFNTIYNVGPVWSAGITGAGQTIAVIENTNILNTGDVTTFRDAFGIGSAAGYSGTFTQVHPSGATACRDPGVTANEKEAALDAEWAGVAAPNANIQIASCQDTGVTFGGLIAANNLIASANPPKIMSLSYGVCESQNGATANAAFVSAWQTAAAKGISVFVAAGDEGATSCDAGANYATQGISVSGFASTPYNVAVGGTDFRDTVDGSNSTYWNSSNGAGRSTAKSYVPEIPWNNSCASSILYTFKGYADGVSYCNTAVACNNNFVSTSAASGGASNYSSKPSWQAGVLGIVNDSKRDLPDVSLFAANGLYGHAMLYCMSDTANGGVTCDFTNTSDALHSVGGGTSFSAPALAGIQALINQATGQSWGNINTRYYALEAKQYGSTVSPNTASVSSCNANTGNGIGGNCVFQDITSGDIAVPCKYGSTNCYSNYTGANNDNCNDASSTPDKASTCGVISTSSSSAQPAYAATPGWDFATGLGSVNVANLVAAMLPPPVASKLKFTVQPVNGAAGSTLATIKVSVESSSGAVATDNTSAITLALANNPGGANLGGTLTVNAVNGVATFSNISLNKLATGYSLSASAPNLTADTSSAFNIGAGAASKLVFVQQPGNALAGSALSPAITVQVQDANGNITTSSAAILLSIGTNPGSAALSGGTANANAGAATFNAATLDKVGSGYTLIASSNGMTSATSAAFNITPGAAVKLVYTTQPPSSLSADATFNASVSVQDANGNVVTSDASSVSLVLSGNPSNVMLASSSMITANVVKGIATFNNLSVNKAGSNYALGATDASLASATSNTFAVIPGSAAKLVYTTAAPANLSSGATFGVTVTVQDVNGNAVTTDASPVTLTLSGGAGNATFSGATTISAINGTATFTGLSVDKIGSNYTLTASDAGLTNTSSNFNVTAGAATKLVFVQQPDSSTAGSALAQAVTVQVLDASGNIVTSDSSSITLALANNPGASGLNGTTTVSAINGVASFANVSLNKAAAGYSLIATDGNLSAASSTTFDISPAATAQLIFATQPSDIMQDQALSNITVTLLDQFQNVVISDSSSVITLAASACSGTSLGAQTVSNGVATFSGGRSFRTAVAALQLTAVAADQPALSATSAPFDVVANPDKVFYTTFESCTP